MKVRLTNLLRRVRDSLWFLPFCMSVLAVLLALGAVRLDAVVAESSPRWLRPFLYAGDLEGARTLLGTIASSMITVAGVTFSLTVVTLSLASTQFGPRLLSSFMRDRGNQFVLGTFIATFLFCLLVLGHGRGEDVPTAYPAFSGTVAVLLAAMSLAVLIYFIHHLASSIRAERVVEVVARDLNQAIGCLLVDDQEEAGKQIGEAVDLEVDATAASDAAGYIQAVDESGLLGLARSNNAVFLLLRRAGHFVVDGEPLVAIAGARADGELAAQIRKCFIIGQQRTQEQDPEFGVHQLVEVALRALSPSMNDPHTAISCINALTAVLCRLARGKLRSPNRFDRDGTLRLIGDPITFAGMLDAAFDQIRQNAATQPAVAIRLLECLRTIATQTNDAERRNALRTQAEMMFEATLAKGLLAKDRQDLEERYRRFAAALNGGATTSDQSSSLFFKEGPRGIRVPL